MEVCIDHIAELYLFEYYENPKEYTLAPMDRLLERKKKAEEEMKRGGYVAALQNYEKALVLNPADTEIRLAMLRCCYHLGRMVSGVLPAGALRLCQSLQSAVCAVGAGGA